MQNALKELFVLLGFLENKSADAIEKAIQALPDPAPAAPLDSKAGAIWTLQTIDV